jgi:hypothetical protein
VRDGDWKLALTYDASRVTLHRLVDDRAEATDVAKENPAIVARLTQLALEWKASLPEKPSPDCISPGGPVTVPSKAKGRPAASAGSLP